MRLVQPRQRTQPVLDLAGDPAHDLTMLAAHVRVQPAEVTQSGRSAGAAEESVPLDENGRAAAARRRGRRRDPRGAAAEHDDFVLGVHRSFARLLAYDSNRHPRLLNFDS